MPPTFMSMTQGSDHQIRSKRDQRWNVNTSQSSTVSKRHVQTSTPIPKHSCKSTLLQLSAHSSMAPLFAILSLRSARMCRRRRNCGSNLLGGHLVHHLQVDAQVGHPIGDLAADPARCDAGVDGAVLAQRALVSVPTPADVTPEATCQRRGDHVMDVIVGVSHGRWQQRRR